VLLLAIFFLFFWLALYKISFCFSFFFNFFGYIIWGSPRVATLRCLQLGAFSDTELNCRPSHSFTRKFTFFFSAAEIPKHRYATHTHTHTHSRWLLKRWGLGERRGEEKQWQKQTAKAKAKDVRNRVQECACRIAENFSASAFRVSVCVCVSVR